MRSAIYPNFKDYVSEIKVGGKFILTSGGGKYIRVVLGCILIFFNHVDYYLEKAKKIYFEHRLIECAGDLPLEIRRFSVCFGVS